MSSDGDHGNSNHEQMQHGQSGHGQASGGPGHSGEGAASALAHMIQQDQKHRRQSGESEEDATRG